MQSDSRFYSLMRMGANSKGKTFLHMEDASHDTLQGALDEAVGSYELHLSDDHLIAIVSTDAWGNSRQEFNTAELSDYVRANYTPEVGTASTILADSRAASYAQLPSTMRGAV